MSSVRLYKQKFNAEDGWYVSDETSEYEGRTLMSLVVGEVVYGSNKKPLSIPIYEEILNSLINQTDRFIIDCGNKDHQLTIIDNGVLVEYSPQKKEQYDKVIEDTNDLIIKFKNNILNARFDIKPLDGSCKFCNYKNVCYYSFKEDGDSDE